MSSVEPRRVATRSTTCADEEMREFDEGSEADETSEESSQTPRTRKPYFVYLMSCNAPQQQQAVKPSRRTLTHIGKSREPVRKVIRHNEGVVNLHKRNAKITPMQWHLEEWVGPFPGRKYAREFQRSWFSKTKGAKTRIEKGVQLANEHKVICYTPRAVDMKREDSIYRSIVRKTARSH